MNWDMIDKILKQTRPNHTGPYRVVLYSRMPYPEGQEATARSHIKFMKIVVERDPRFCITEVHAEFGVRHTKLSSMREYQRIIEKCKAGEVDLIMIHDISRLAQDTLHLMKNVEPIADCQPEIGVLSFQDRLLVMSGDATGWAEKMASGDYSACRLPYFVGFIPPAPDRSEI